MKEDYFYHLGFGKKNFSENIPEWAILSGDPDRAERIAKNYLEQPKELSRHRGLSCFVGKTKNGTPVISATSGMGAPSLSIVFNELAQLGIKKMIRVGTTGSIQAKIKVGDVIVSQASLCRQGAANDIAPIEFPAAADPFLSVKLFETAKNLGLNSHIGVTASVDTFYEGQERRESANPYLIRRIHGMTEEYKNLGILNFEMESGTFFKMGLVYRISTACVCGVIAERSSSESVDRSEIEAAEDNAIKVAVQSIS